MFLGIRGNVDPPSPKASEDRTLHISFEKDENADENDGSR